VRKVWWGDGTSRNDVSLYKCSGTPGPLEPLDESSRKNNAPSLYIPVILHQPERIAYCKMTGMFQSKDIVSQGTINLVIRGPRTIVRRHIVWDTPSPHRKFMPLLPPNCTVFEKNIFGQRWLWKVSVTNLDVPFSDLFHGATCSEETLPSPLSPWWHLISWLLDLYKKYFYARTPYEACNVSCC